MRVSCQRDVTIVAEMVTFLSFVSREDNNLRTESKCEKFEENTSRTRSFPSSINANVESVEYSALSVSNRFENLTDE